MRCLILAGLLISTTAWAHIHLTSPLPRTDSELGDQKDQHCGVAGQQRNPARVTTYRPGETITVAWKETVNHPGWFRIAFQPNGDTFRIPPASNGDAVNANGATVASNMPTEDRTGMADETGAIVLKDRILDGTLTTTVTLPDMECSNCTLQFIQVMIDKPIYTADAASDDIYFNCADIALSNTPMPMVDAGTDQDAAVGGGNNPSTNGGCSSTGGASLLAGLALLTLRRRRDRSPA